MNPIQQLGGRCDAVLVTHPKNRVYKQAIQYALDRIGERYGMKFITVAYDPRCPERRKKPDGSDDGPYFKLLTGTPENPVVMTMALATPQGMAR